MLSLRCVYIWYFAMFNDKKKLLLAFILVLSAMLRFIFITRHDPYTDEVLLGVRAIGMVDYDASDLQTTPWQWVESVPGWMHLSFHDHPVLFFLFQNLTLSIFGENMFGLRLPAVLAGIASVYLIYLLASKLMNKQAGFIAAAILAVQSYHIWVSRVGLQDGLMILFFLLTVWLWILALQNDKWWLWILWGTSLGLGLITKFTILIVIPILCVYALVYKHNFFVKKYFWYGVLVFLVVSLPSTLYNILLYKNFGHFDFQISALLHQNVPRWSYRQGRQMVGGLSSRITLFFEVLRQANSWIFNGAFVLSFLYAIYLFIKTEAKALVFLASAVLLEWLWFLVIGSTFRFVIMIIPLFILIISYVAVEVADKIKRKNIVYAFFAIFIIMEILFTVNTFLLLKPIGMQNVTYAQLNIETKNFGFNEVNDYLDNLLKNKVSAAFGQPEYQFLTDLHNKAIKEAKVKKYTPYPVIIIYDNNFNYLSRLWTFQRRLIYYGWPIMSDNEFLAITKEEKDEYYRKQGIKDFVYITSGENIDFGVTSLYAPYKITGAKNVLAEYLDEKGIKSEFIKNQSGQNVFKVYKF